jgi:hypothetical protein
MSDARPPNTDAGYRGALPPRNDWLARGWVLVVIGIFLAMFVLDVLNFPTSVLPEPTPLPVPSVSESVAPSGSGAPSGSPAESAAASESETESPSP